MNYMVALETLVDVEASTEAEAFDKAKSVFVKLATERPDDMILTVVDTYADTEPAQVHVDV